MSDVNDNFPAFEKSQWQVELTENTFLPNAFHDHKQLSFLLKAYAVDHDLGTNAELIYSIEKIIAKLAKNGKKQQISFKKLEDYFQVDQNTGDVTITTSLMDREVFEAFEVTVSLLGLFIICVFNKIIIIIENIIVIMIFFKVYLNRTYLKHRLI